MKWEVEFHKDFDPEFDALPDDVQNELRSCPVAGAVWPAARQAPRRSAQRFAPREYEGVAL
ncbi:hypothetical protein SBA4_3420005 [Candidatus Sulfopaludibacter sp. SbA4]|nr:hypothetical protein SBA4_3420005 [Candidatus Sulfopaludibacter sp. SbA4]